MAGAVIFKSRAIARSDNAAAPCTVNSFASLAEQGYFDVTNKAFAKPALIESSCCGMAGSFGYEAEHHAVSMQMAELSLLPAVRGAGDAWIVADGASCRHQIADGAQREALHAARLA